MSMMLYFNKSNSKAIVDTTVCVSVPNKYCATQRNIIKCKFYLIQYGDTVGNFYFLPFLFMLDQWIEVEGHIFVY